MSHNLGPEQDNPEIRDEMERWWYKEGVKEFAKCFKGRGDRKEQRKEEFVEYIISKRTSDRCETAYRCEDLKGEVHEAHTQSPMFAKIERLTLSLTRNNDILYRYKTKLREFLNNEQFNAVKEEFEGTWEPLKWVMMAREEHERERREKNLRIQTQIQKVGSKFRPSED